MSDDRDRLAPPGLFRMAAEAVLLLLIVIAPWPFASVDGPWETLHFAIVALLVSLWAVYGLIQKQLSIRPDAISLVLLLLAIITLVQIVPLPESLVGIVSSRRVQIHRELVPAVGETLVTAGDPESASLRSAWLTLSVDPFLSQQFLARILGLLLLYTVVRSWVSSREFFRRLAVIVAVNGIAIAVLAMAQFFSSDRDMVYWTFHMPGASVFGPFVCRNHYPDYALFALGLGLATIVSRKEPKKPKVQGVEYSTGIVTKIVDSPDLFVLGLGLVLILASIPFSLSRGGMIGTTVAIVAVAVTAWQVRGRITAGLAIGAVVIVLALMLAGWFGWASVADRLSTLSSGEAARGRTDLWRDVFHAAPGFIALGGGNGALARFEPLGRVDVSPVNYIVDFAHNEYLEALVEGGLPRLLLTLVLVYFVIRTCLSAYRRLVDRSTGPLVLGAMLGLVGLCVHSIVDFGIHMPAIVALGTVVLACVADAATDSSYVPVRKGGKSPPSAPDRGKYVLRGVPLYAFMGLVTVLAVLLLWDAARRGEAAALKNAARDVQRFNHPKQFDLRVQYLTRAADCIPSDGEAQAKLAEAVFDRARDRQRTAVMALAGGAVLTISPLELFEQYSGDDVREGLRAALRARDRSPLLPAPHLFLGLYHSALAKAEPPRAYFDRAVICSPTDPEVFVLRGAEAANRRDFTPAVADWQKAMRLSPATIARVLRIAQRDFEPRRVLQELLPADPLVLLTAVEQLHPVWKPGEAAARRTYLDRIVSLAGRGEDFTATGWDALARAQAELELGDAATLSWANAIRKDAKSADIRNRFAQWLERDERYDAAEEQLQWLQEFAPGLAELQLRIDAVRHARELKRILDSK